VRLLYYPDARLRRRAEPIPASAFGTPGIDRYGQALASVLGSVGEDQRGDVLASTQVDLDPPFRMLALKTASGITLLCNPTIKSYGDEVEEFEASLSFLCVPVRLPAPRKLTVEYRRPDGARREVVCDPTGARAVWQGCESLDGRMVVDRLPPLGKLAFVARYRRELDGALVVPSTGVDVTRGKDDRRARNAIGGEGDGRYRTSLPRNATHAPRGDGGYVHGSPDRRR
jgi:peptide deformylase